MATKPGIIYRMDWKTVKDNGTEFSMEVNIYDKSVQIDSITGEEIIIPMTASGHPLRISTDKSEDKFTPIRSKTATITFLNSDAVNFSTFSTGEDDRFIVDITAGGIFIFRGFLQMSDIREPFLTQKDQEVTLTAVDGLAFLKGTPLTDSKDGPFSGQNRLIDYISMCLFHGTGLSLNINVFNNIREEANPGRWQTAAQFTSPNIISVPSAYARYFKAGHALGISGSASNNGSKVIFAVNEFLGIITTTGGITNEALGPTITFEDQTDGGCMYSTCLVDAKTFEDKIGATLDCYEILTRILKRECFIEQVLGEWYIFRIKELRNDFQQYRTQYTSDGSFNGFTSGYNLEKAIGLQQLDSTGANIPFAGTPDATAFFSEKQTSRVNSRPIGSVKLTHNFESPSEVPCNIDFSRDTVDNPIGTLPDETDEDGNTAQVFKYNIDCWTLKRGAGSSATTPNCQAYIKRLLVNGYEKQRYVVLTLPTVQGNPKNYIESEDIPIGAKDKFSFSVDWATEVDVSGSPTLNEPVASIWMAGDDGTFWKLSQGPPVAWLTTNAADSYGLNTNLIYPLDFSQDTSTWVSISIDAPPVPVSGNLRIRLHSSGAFASTSVDDFNVRFQNLNFDYIPFISGSYKKFSGQSNKTTRPGNYKSKLEDNVYISNSPKKLFKGALHIKNYNTNAYILAGQFYDGQEFLYANDGRNHTMSYGELQVRAVHNQYRNADEVYQLTAQGLNGSNDIDLIHRVINRDIEPATNNNIYQLCWIDQDWRNSEWQAMMIRNFGAANGFVDNDAFEFRYETS